MCVGCVHDDGERRVAAEGLCFPWIAILRHEWIVEICWQWWASLSKYRFACIDVASLSVFCDSSFCVCVSLFMQSGSIECRRSRLLVLALESSNCCDGILFRTKVMVAFGLVFGLTLAICSVSILHQWLVFVLSTVTIDDPSGGERGGHCSTSSRRAFCSTASLISYIVTALGRRRINPLRSVETLLVFLVCAGKRIRFPG